MESVLHSVPLLGTARRYLALARLSAALEALLSAGVSIVQAWELAGVACGSPALRRASEEIPPAVEAGEMPSEVLSRSGKFPDMFVGQYVAGEISGKLEETLVRLHRYYGEEGSRKLHLVAQWTPRAVYLVVMLAIAYRIVQFWSGYFRQIQDAGGF